MRSMESCVFSYPFLALKDPAVRGKVERLYLPLMVTLKPLKVLNNMKNKLEKNQNKVNHQEIIQDYIALGHFLRSGVWMEIKKRLGNVVEVLSETTPHPAYRQAGSHFVTPPLEGEVSDSELKQSEPLSTQGGQVGAIAPPPLRKDLHTVVQSVYC